jgi:hypothetical protein
MNGKRVYSILVVALAVVSLGIVAQPARAQLPGAIFTTLEDGSRVNANIYEFMEDVYLDGGPSENAPSTAAALLPGHYYFQVTDPSGQHLLSEDPVECRRFTVGDAGWIVSVGNLTTLEKIKGQWTAVDCAHATGIDEYDYGCEDPDAGCAITVQLMPYKKTPNKGGVYKVWITPVDKFVGDPTQLAGTTRFHGFVPSWSKTDNYKVLRPGPPCEPPTITIRKFKDCDADGLLDGEEELYEDWGVIAVTDPLGVTELYYETPVVIDMAVEEGTWKICEIIDPLVWKQTALWVDGVQKDVSPCTYVEIADGCSGETHEVQFGNVPLTCVTACKFYDVNGNGIEDGPDGPVAGIRITLEGIDVTGAAVGPIMKETDEGGCVEFCKLLPGEYTFTEELPSGPCIWFNSTPTTVTVPVNCNGTVEPVKFGNYAITYADFGTKGYWHNKNGLQELTTDDRDYVNTLAPYETASSYFGAGDEPFNGFFGDGTPVEAAFNSDDGSLIWGAGTWQAEVSQFLVDANAGGDPREQLAQQLLAFIFNAIHRAGLDGAIILGNGAAKPVAVMIAEAIAVWESGSPAEQTAMQELLESFNSSDAVPVILGEPCEVVY